VGQIDDMEAKDMRRSTIAGSVVTFISLCLFAPLFAAGPPGTGTVNSPSASEKSVSATKPGPIADVPGWRRQQIAAAQTVTNKNTPFRLEELLGTEVRSPQDELLGSVENLVRSRQTDKIA
jgi:hypothetical protein